jgi:endoglucanase
MTILSRRSKLAVLAGLCLALVVPASSQAAVAHDSSTGSVQFDQPAYTAHENQGYLTITINRTGDLSGQEHVGYGVKRQDAQPGIDFDTIANNYIVLEPGQSTYTFNVHIIDQGMDGTPVKALAYLYSAWPEKLGANNNAPVTILHDDPLQARDPLNPLGVPGPYAGNLLAGTKFYVDPDTGAAKAQRQYARSNPAWSNALGDIASEPGAHRFYFWNTPAWPAHTVARYLETVEARHPGTVQQLSTYSLVHAHCGADTSSPAFIRRYQRWMQGLSRGIGNFHVVMFLELDSLITTQCMAHQPAKLAARLSEVRDAVEILQANPHVAVYIDGGAADAISWRRTVSLLRRADVAGARGFFLNSTHFDWTTKEVAFGQKIARALGGVHFVVNTAENGQGPLVPKVRFHHGNEELCNPAGRGLGPLSTETGYSYVDAFLWFTNPGGSAGQGPGCGTGAPPTAVFWPQYAAGLAQRANFHITGPREHLLHDGPYVAYDKQTSPGAPAPR